MNTNEQPQQSGPTNYFFGNINNYNVYQSPVNFNAPIKNMVGTASDKDTDYGTPDDGKVATKEMMSHAAMATLKNGYWKAQRSWSVVYEIYCIWGYEGSISDFLVEVIGWPDQVYKRMTCNRDAVSKLRNKYTLTRDITEWRKNGVPEEYCILGEQLTMDLEQQLLSGESKAQD